MVENKKELHVHLIIRILVTIFFATCFAVVFIQAPELTYDFLEKKGLSVTENTFPAVFFLVILINMLFHLWIYNSMIRLLDGIPASKRRLRLYLEKIFIQDDIGFVFILIIFTWVAMWCVEYFIGIRMQVQDPKMPHLMVGGFLMMIYMLVLDYRYRHRDDVVV